MKTLPISIKNNISLNLEQGKINQIYKQKIETHSLIYAF
jgi:hypothetical protein